MQDAPDASRVVTRHDDRTLAPAGLRANGQAILARRGPEGPSSPSTLAAQLAIDRKTLSAESGPLPAAGLLESRADARDGRRRLLSLSRDGSALLRAARPLWAEARRMLGDGFGADRTEGLVKELRALVGALA